MTMRMLIGGALRAGGTEVDVVDPGSGEIIAACGRASLADLDDAVAAATTAYPAWSTRPIAERQAVLRAMADAVEAERAALAELLTREQGKPLAQAQGEVDGVSFLFRHYAAVDIPVQLVQDSAEQRVELHRVPLGVVGAIVPWNYPMFMAATKIAPSLLAGNTVVLKPSPTTPLATLRMGELLADIVPAGVLNILADAGSLGGALSAHPGIRKVSFTGSTATGIKVMSAAAATLKRLTLELGGNDSGIVLDDVDPAAVARQVFDAAFLNSGQVCVALKRLYVPDSLYDAMCDALATLADTAILGHGLDPATTMGPVQNQAQYERVLALIETARADGTIITGGERLNRPGYFIPPTIVRDIADGTELVDSEQFGPVLPVIRYSDIDSAVRHANASEYGLGNSVWSNQPERARAVAASLDSGTVWINQHGVVAPTAPFAGAKMSGIGAEFAEDGLAEVTQIKVISQSLAPIAA